MAEAVDGVKRGTVVTVEVTAIEEGGVEVEYNGVKSFIRRSDLARDRQDQRPDRFAVGEKLDARVQAVEERVEQLFGGTTSKRLSIRDNEGWAGGTAAADRASLRGGPRESIGR